MEKVTVISKADCHLCERVISILDSLKQDHSFELSVLDINQDPSLFDKYWLKIPVVRIGEKDVFAAEDIAHPSDYKTKLEQLVESL